MDSKRPSELTEEELADVKKAMQEFSKGSWAPSPQKVTKNPHRAPLPVKPLLIISAALFVLVALMVLIAILPQEDTSSPTDPPVQTSAPPDTQSTHFPTTEIEMTAQETELPTQATALATQATEAPTQVTEPPTDVTEPHTQPTEPPVEIPDGTPLSDSKLNVLQTRFSWPSLYASVSKSSFSNPAELNLQILIGDEASDQTSDKLTGAEQAYLATISEDYLYLDTYRVPKAVAARVVEQYYGLSLDDIPSAQTSVYWEETDSFYFILDADFCQLNITHAVQLEEGNIWVRYEDTQSDRTGEMILKPTDDTYQILSNQTT